MPRGNAENMRPMNTLTVEEQRKIASAGGKASGKARRNKAMLRDCLQILMEKKMLDENGNKITGAEALSVEVFQKALAGDMKAWELLRDTAGQKPADKIEQTNTNITIDFGELDEDQRTE